MLQSRHIVLGKVLFGRQRTMYRYFVMQEKSVLPNFQDVSFYIPKAMEDFGIKTQRGSSRKRLFYSQTCVFKYILKDSHDGVEHSESLDFCTLSIVWYS
jgi:hypothetical protein